MSKFTHRMKNLFSGENRVRNGETMNMEGHRAYRLSDKATLVQMASTWLVAEPRFYGKPGDIQEKITSLVEKVLQEDPEFVLKLALYLRKELYLRSAPVYLLALAARHEGSKPHVRAYAPRIISRADEICEVLGCYLDLFGKPIPNSLKKGMNDAFLNFDEYQFAKYYKRKSHPNFRDVCRLTHPREPQELLQKIMKEELAVPYTWETELSAIGGTTEEERSEAKQRAWTQLVLSGKLPYMASLRNLRNILMYVRHPMALKKVENYIGSEDAVRKSKQFPFRFFSAYMMLKEAQLDKGKEPGNQNMRSWKPFSRMGRRTVGAGVVPAVGSNPYTGRILDALERAATISFGNIPRMPGVSLLAADVSGSMFTPVSKNSKIKLYHIGLMLMAGANRFTEGAITGIFGDRWMPYAIPRKAGVLGTVIDLEEIEGKVGYSTNGHRVIEYLLEQKIPVNRILIFTDCQMWDSSGRGGHINDAWKRYRREVNPRAYLYLFNLNAYGSVQFPASDRQVVNISGWSEKIFNFIQQNEVDPGAQVKQVENYGI